MKKNRGETSAKHQQQIELFQDTDELGRQDIWNSDIAKHISPEPNTGCWIWTGASCGQRKYGQYAIKRRMTPAHRYVFQRERRITIPEGMEIDHLCKLKLCVNPDHLEIVTHSENIRRSYRRRYERRSYRTIDTHRATRKRT